MVYSMRFPNNKLTLGSTALENDIVSASVVRNECGFDNGRIVLPDTDYFPGTVTAGTTVKLEVKDNTESTYTTLLKGIVRYIIPDISSKGRNLTLACDGAGWGLDEMTVPSEFGSQSVNSIGTDTITEILTDATKGIIPKFCNKIFNSATNSGYSFDTTNVESVGDAVPYISFPYKNARACLNDLVDLACAMGEPVHWIVTPHASAATEYLRLKNVNDDQTGWSHYYGGSQAAATLTYGVDYTNINLEKMDPEANYVIYYGEWRRPSNGDAWTENTTSLWGTGASMTKNTYPAVVNSYSVGAYVTASPSGAFSFFYPAAQNAAWDFSGFTEFNTPNLNFYANPGAIPSFGASDWYVRLATDSSNYFACKIENWTAVDIFHHFSIPLGSYFNVKGRDANILKWSQTGSPSWANINYIEFANSSVQNLKGIAIDGLHFGDAHVCRVAWNSDLPGNFVKQRLIVDNVGKDDELKSGTPGTTDVGLMAQMAKAELLRLQSAATVGTVTTPMIKDLLPGQCFSIQGITFRVTRIIHTLDAENGYMTQSVITDDLTNSRTRQRYEDSNKLLASIRPDFQDRAASSQKASSVDWRVTRLVEDYAPP